MASNIFDKLNMELTKAKEERPKLEKDTQSSLGTKMLDESTGTTPRPLFFHVSHNSHGDWGKHWAHGGYEDEEATDSVVPAAPPTPL